MNSPEESGDAEEKRYENYLFYFISDLKILAEESEVQCLLKRYDNVAWEIREFSLSSSTALATLYSMRLTHKQINGLNEIILKLRNVPDHIVNVTNIKEEHRRAMSDACWSAIRLQASQLLEDLRSEEERVDPILWPPD